MIDVNSLSGKDFNAMTISEYYATFASHIGMWQLRDRLTKITKDVLDGKASPAKTKGIVFELGPEDADFSIVKVAKDEYLVRTDSLTRVSTGVCIGINTKVLNRLTNNDFTYVANFWDANEKDKFHHITEDGLYRGLKS